MNCTALLLIAASTISAAVTVDVETLDGRTLSGELHELSADQIGLRTSVGDEKLPYDALMRVDIEGEEAPPAEGGAQLLLADGTQLDVKKYTLENRTFVVDSAGFSMFEVPAAALRLLRFNADQRSFDARWDELLGEKILGDAVVIRRQDDLSYQEAIIQSIADGKAAIQLDELEAKIPLDKLAGLLFYQRNNRKLGAPLCKIELRDGGVIFAGKIMLEEDLLKIESSAGGKFELPFASVQALDFAAGNIVSLADLTPDQDAWATFIPSSLPRDQLSLIYAPDVRTGSSALPLELSIGGESKSFASGIALHARTELTYLLPDDVRQFHAFAGLPDGASGPLKLTITADKTTLIDKVLDQNEPTLDIHGDVRGARRLKVVVDFAGNGDLGDRVYLCQPRLIK